MLPKFARIDDIGIFATPLSQFVIKKMKASGRLAHLLFRMLIHAQKYEPLKGMPTRI